MSKWPTHLDVQLHRVQISLYTFLYYGAILFFPLLNDLYARVNSMNVIIHCAQVKKVLKIIDDISNRAMGTLPPVETGTCVFPFIT